MKRVLIYAAATVMAGISEAAAATWSLDSCITYALDHNLTVRSRQLDRYSGELDVTEAKDRFLPQAQANAGQSFSFGRGLTSQNTYADRNTSNFSWGINMSLPLFQGLSATRRVDYAKANLRTLVEEVEAIKDNITLNVISAYLQALYCGEMVDVATEQLRISRIELERRSQLLDAGKIPELDMTQAEAQVAQDELTLVNAANDRRMALVDLAQLLDLPDVDSFDIAPLPDDEMPLLSAESVYEKALGANHSILAGRRNMEAADKNLSLARTGYLPTLSFNAGVGSTYYRVSGFDNEAFGAQMRHNFNTSLGFSLSIPIFDAFSTRNSIRRAKVQQLNARLRYEESERTLFKDIQQAYYKAIGSREKMKASEISVKAARAAFEAMEEKYNYGRANATEFEQAKTDYIKALAESVQARYESMLRLRILNFYNKD